MAGEELNGLMEKVSTENASMAQALQTPPPSAVSQSPTLDGMGLEALQIHMSENGYATLLSLVHWAILCQRLSDGEEIIWSNETYAAMQAPFVGFGNPFMWENTYQANIGRIVHAHFFNWHTRGRRNRRENRFPDIIVREVAPLLANQAKGYQSSMEVQDIVADPAIYKGLK